MAQNRKVTGARNYISHLKLHGVVYHQVTLHHVTSRCPPPFVTLLECDSRDSAVVKTPIVTYSMPTRPITFMSLWNVIKNLIRFSECDFEMTVRV